tara:strand:- start:704 stop:1168 length:465 start_codon:yes stop_codon:yes gene_type:complete
MSAYGTDLGLTDYATATGRTVTGTAAQLRAAATDYLDGTYWYRFKGTALTDDNAYPRVGSTVVPDRIDRATYEAALILDADASALSTGSVTNNSAGAIASEKVDVISVSYHAPNMDSMSDDTVLDNAPKYSAIENILRPLLNRWDGADAAAFVV